MELSEEQVKRYGRDGFLVLDNLLSSSELDVIKKEVSRLADVDSPGRILEEGGSDVKTYFGAHYVSEILTCLGRLPRLLTPARQLLGSDVYIHQYKFNPKVGLRSDPWEWHHDFQYWHLEDGMPDPRVVTLAIFLDDVSEFSGPLMMIPGSHKHVSETTTFKQDVAKSSDEPRDGESEPAWMSALHDAAKYEFDPEVLAGLISKFGITSLKGTAGFAVLFHGCVVHASSANMTPWDRNVVLVSYNSVENALKTLANPRPNFIAERDFTPTPTVSDRALAGFVPDES